MLAARRRQSTAPCRSLRRHAPASFFRGSTRPWKTSAARCAATASGVSAMNENSIARRAASVMRMFLAPSDGEKLNAVGSLLHLLADIDLDIHVLAELLAKRIEGKSSELNAAEMQRIYDAAYQKGLTDGS